MKIVQRLVAAVAALKPIPKEQNVISWPLALGPLWYNPGGSLKMQFIK
jgi:hypothetical protein